MMSTNKPYAIVLLKGEPAMPVTRQQLFRMLEQGQLSDEDHVRKGDQEKWVPVGQAAWLQGVLDSGDETSGAESSDGDLVQDEDALANTPDRGKNSLVFGIVLAVVLLVVAVGYNGLISRGGSGAEAYVAKELAAWHAGGDTELYTPFLNELELIDYATLSAEPSQAYEDAYNVMVRLTFANGAIRTHTFTVQYDVGGWHVLRFSKY